jgi:hypothetical protein
MPYPYAAAPFAFAAGPTPGKRRRPGYLLAGIGGAIALIAYFSLPLFVISVAMNASSINFNYANSQSVTASQVNGVLLGSGFALSSFFWIGAVLAGAAVLASVLVPFTSLAASRSLHVLDGMVFLFGALAAAVVFVVGTLQFNDQYTQYVSSLLGGGSSDLGALGVNYSVGIGYGLFVLVGGLVLVLFGGILVLARGDR